MPHPQLDLIGIAVKDMPTALKFYRAMGFDIPAEMDSEGHVEYQLANGLRLAWDTHEVLRSFDDHWTPVTEGHRIGLAFLCENSADVDAQYQRLIDMGYQGHNAPFDAFWGQRYAQVYDADKNIIDLFAPLE